MGDRAEQLAALLRAVQAEGGDGQGESTRAAIEGVRDAIGAALARGVGAELMQLALDQWRTATGGPRITVLVDGQPGA